MASILDGKIRILWKSKSLKPDTLKKAIGRRISIPYTECRDNPQLRGLNQLSANYLTAWYNIIRLELLSQQRNVHCNQGINNPVLTHIIFGNVALIWYVYYCLVAFNWSTHRGKQLHQLIQIHVSSSYIIWTRVQRLFSPPNLGGDWLAIPALV